MDVSRQGELFGHVKNRNQMGFIYLSEFGKNWYMIIKPMKANNKGSRPNLYLLYISPVNSNWIVNTDLTNNYDISILGERMKGNGGQEAVLEH